MPLELFADFSKTVWNLKKIRIHSAFETTFMPNKIRLTSRFAKLQRSAIVLICSQSSVVCDVGVL